MEQYAYKDLTLEIFKEILMEDEFRDFSDVGIVLQAYLPESQRDAADLLEWARRRGTPIWVRLVKGAYWDYETVVCQAHGWPIPVYQQKWESDANFERLTRFLMENYRWLRPALGSHNLRSLSHGIACAEQLGVPEHAYELQMLYGMGAEQAQLLADRGHRVRIYTPFGELIPGMAYLVRRLLENTSNDSFLRQSFTEHVSIEELLMKPADAAAHAPPVRAGTRSLVHERAADRLQSGRGASGHGTGRQRGRRPVRQGISARHQRAGRREQELDRVAEPVAQVAGGRPAFRRPARKRRRWPSRRPAVRSNNGPAPNPATAPNTSSWRPPRCAITASSWPPGRSMSAASRGPRRMPTWPRRSISACITRTRSASWPSGRRVDRPGEENVYSYRPRGVAAVIAPWNFPLAILTGMTAAALATGNTVS